MTTTDVQSESGQAALGNAFFLCKLLPPRPTFMQDMNAEERAVMQAHAGYWQTQLEAGAAIVFGPVADPNGGFGIGIMRVADETALLALQAQDPAIRAGRGFRYENLPMPRVVYQRDAGDQKR